VSLIGPPAASEKLPCAAQRLVEATREISERIGGRILVDYPRGEVATRSSTGG
jgi:hypothetical protein